MTDEPFFSRWSRRKTASKAGAAGPTADAVAAEAGTQAASAPVLDAAPSARAEPEPLPPIESLTPESDFAAFMKPEVDPSLKRQAFKKLIEDPRYNVMDGLDVYIDDYSKADPLPEGWLEKMKAVRYLGIFKEEAEEEAGKDPDGEKREPAALPEAMAPEPVSFPEAPAPADTSSDQNPPPDVGKSGFFRE